MADRGGFDEFVAARSQALLRTAYLLTGDHALAEDDVRVSPGAPGGWSIGVLEPLFPDRLTAADLRGALLSGHSASDRISVVVPGNVRLSRSVQVVALCVRGVRLEIGIAGRPAGTLACADADVNAGGLVPLVIRDPVLTRLGLRPLQRVEVTVRQVAGPARQWGIVAVG